MKVNRISELEGIIDSITKNSNDEYINLYTIIEELSHETLTQNQYERIIKILAKFDDDYSTLSGHKAIFLYKSKNYDLAIVHLKQFIKVLFSDDSISASELIYLVFSYASTFNNQFYDIIMKIALDFVSGENSENEMSLVFRGLLEKDAERFIDYLLRAIQFNNDSWISYFFLGDTYYNQKNYYAALGYYSEFVKVVKKLKIEPYFLSEVYFQLGFINDLNKNYDASEKAYRSCIKLTPDFPNANNNLGYCLFKQNKNVESLKIFDSCIKNKMDGEFPIFNKIRILKKMGKYSEALTFIEKYEKTIKDGKSITKMKIEILKSINKTLKQEEEVLESESEVIATINIKSSTLPQKVSNRAYLIDPFSKERELEFLLEQRIRNGDRVLNRKLKMYNDLGRQYSTPIGRIDLLTLDEETNEIIIFELKKGKSDDEVFGQVSRYIGFVKENLAKPNQIVKGIIYVYSASDKLNYAAKSSSDIYIHEYKNMKF